MSDNNDGHTPGPWTFDGMGVVLGTKNSWLDVPQVERNGRPVVAQVERLSDAQLIAAAPELLEAAKEAYASLPVTASPQEFLNGSGNWGLSEQEYRTANALASAIAKAEGA